MQQGSFFAETLAGFKGLLSSMEGRATNGQKGERIILTTNFSIYHELSVLCR